MFDLVKESIDYYENQKVKWDEIKDKEKINFTQSFMYIGDQKYHYNYLGLYDKKRKLWIWSWGDINNKYYTNNTFPITNYKWYEYKKFITKDILEYSFSMPNKVQNSGIIKKLITNSSMTIDKKELLIVLFFSLYITKSFFFKKITDTTQDIELYFLI